MMLSRMRLRAALAMSMLSLCDALSSIPCVVVDVAVDGHGSRRQMATNAVMPMPMAKPSRMAWWGFMSTARKRVADIPSLYVVSGHECHVRYAVIGPYMHGAWILLKHLNHKPARVFTDWINRASWSPAGREKPSR